MAPRMRSAGGRHFPSPSRLALAADPAVVLRVEVEELLRLLVAHLRRRRREAVLRVLRRRLGLLRGLRRRRLLWGRWRRRLLRRRLRLLRGWRRRRRGRRWRREGREGEGGGRHEAGDGGLRLRLRGRWGGRRALHHQPRRRQRVPGLSRRRRRWRRRVELPQRRRVGSGRHKAAEMMAAEAASRTFHAERAAPIGRPRRAPVARLGRRPVAQGGETGLDRNSGGAGRAVIGRARRRSGRGVPDWVRGAEGGETKVGGIADAQEERRGRWS